MHPQSRSARWASLRFGALILTALVWATHAQAGTSTAYTDRNAWQGAAQAAGLDVAVETFNGFNPVFPAFPITSFPVGPATFSVPEGFGHFDYTHDLLRDDQSDLVVDYIAVTQGSFVFGLGFDYEVTPLGGPSIVVTDLDNELQTGPDRLLAPTGFLGIICTSAIDPDNPQYTPMEIAVYSSEPLGGATLDNLSVAYAVPEPGTGLLLGVSVAGLCAWRKPHRPANPSNPGAR